MNRLLGLTSLMKEFFWLFIFFTVDTPIFHIMKILTVHNIWETSDVLKAIMHILVMFNNSFWDLFLQHLLIKKKDLFMLKYDCIHVYIHSYVYIFIFYKYKEILLIKLKLGLSQIHKTYIQEKTPSRTRKS